MKAPGTWNVFRVGGVRVQRARDDRSLPAKGTPLIVRIRDARGPRHGFFNFNFNSGPQRFGQFPTAAPGTYLSLLEIPSVGQMGLVYCSSHFYPCGHSIFSLRLPCIRLPPFCSYCHVKRPLMWYQLTPPQPQFSFSVCYPLAISTDHVSTLSPGHFCPQVRVYRDSFALEHWILKI